MYDIAYKISRFTFASMRRQPAENGIGAIGKQPDKRTVLVIDDDDSILDLLEYLLTDNGYRVRVARDGQEALNLVAHEQPDLILLDLMMPVVNGWEVMWRLRQDDETVHIPVIIISADQNVAKKANDLEAEDYIAKPFDVDEIVGKIGRLLA